MVSVRPVAPSDFEQIYPLLDWHDPSLGKSAWQRIFDYAWAHESPYCGYALFEGREAVGFIGFIFSDRAFSSISRSSAKFCNLTTWVVKPQYRGHSLALMMPVVRMKDRTITDLSAGDGVIKVSKRLGFKVLDDAVKILLPQGLSAQEMADGLSGATLADSIFADEAIASLSLPSVAQTIYQDHRLYPNCHQLVLKTDGQCCHVVYTLNCEAELSYSHVQYISNLSLFEQYQVAIRQHIIRQSGLPLIAIDLRLIESIKLSFSYHLPLSSARIYRPASASSMPLSQIDNLYSELILLDFGTADALALGWREKALSVCSPAIKKLARCG